MALTFADPLVESLFRDPDRAGYPASALVSQFLAADEGASALDRHAFAERLASALACPADLGPDWIAVAAELPVGYRMRALWRVLDVIYRETGISGEPVG